ncbi:hypothetical protein [Streptomyces sp. SID3343]|uniref:hypothetical protein n=1 Tax=Streptomyces sp. SID3343 TaxID=2690260 RepID=UPI0013703909|nr:hypothetical protein [Streptomyces sp. SID3343]MYW02405.1 hypothetical protein [Streptomyces sp. SID3343]
MTSAADDRLDLTPAEAALLADPGARRGGYSPTDEIPEPACGPSEPATVSAPAPESRPGTVPTPTRTQAPPPG